MRTIEHMTNTTTTPNPGTLPLSPGTWSLDAAHSSVHFAIRHLGISKVRGAFRDFSVDTTIGTSLDTTQVTAAIDVASIDTGNPDRDAHVLAEDLLDVARRPQLRFRSTAIRPNDGLWLLDGELSLGDATHPITLDVELGGIDTFPVDGSTHAGFEAHGRFDRHDFGLDFGMLDAGLGRKIDVVLDIQLIAPDDPSS